MLDSPPARRAWRPGWLLLTAAIGLGSFFLGEWRGVRSYELLQVAAVARQQGLPAGSQALPAGGGSVQATGPAPAARSEVTPPAPLSAVAEVAAPDGGSGAVAPALGADAGTGTRQLSLTLAGSLDESVAAAIPGPAGPPLTSVISRILVWWLNPAREVRPGDRLWLLYALPEGQEPLVLALRYQSQRLGGPRTALRYQAPGAPFARYYDETGQEVEERLVDSPLADYDQITSLLRDGRGHKGVDFKVPVGTPVLAPVDGRITKRNWKVRANGDCLGLEDRRSGRELLFLHLSEIAPEIRVGSDVHRGQPLGRSGNTGHTTAPHLHYQMMAPDGRVLDPFAVTATTRRALSPTQSGPFNAALPGLIAQLLGPQRSALPSNP